MSRLRKSVEKIDISESILDFVNEIEEQYLVYLKLIKSLGWHDEKRFLRIGQREDVIESNQIENISSVVTAFFSPNKYAYEQEKIIRSIKARDCLEKKDLDRMHKVVMASNKACDKKIGDYRNNSVFIGYFDGDEKIIDYVPPVPEKIEEYMLEFFDYYNEYLHNDERLNHPFIKPAITQAYLLSIHPYQDGNGRISRMLHHAELWKSTCLRYDLNLFLPPFYFSNSYNFAKFGYCKRLSDLQQNDFSNEMWNAWIYYNLIIMNERLPHLIEEIKTIEKMREQRKTYHKSLF